MEQYKVGIYDEDASYMISLMNHINSDRENPMFALAFSTLEELHEYMSGRHLDILLVDEKVADDGLQPQRMNGACDTMESQIVDGLGIPVKMLILSRNKQNENGKGIIFK